MTKSKLKAPSRVPDCYGNLYDPDCELCQSCLLNSQCSEAMKVPKLALGQVVPEEEQSKDKKQKILQVCRKFGIEAVWKNTKTGITYEITAENLDWFQNVDFLLVSKDALKQLLSVGPNNGNGNEED